MLNIFKKNCQNIIYQKKQQFSLTVNTNSILNGGWYSSELIANMWCICAFVNHKYPEYIRSYLSLCCVPPKTKAAPAAPSAATEPSVK